MTYFTKALLALAAVGVLIAPITASAESYYTKTLRVPSDLTSDTIFPTIDPGNVQRFALVVENPYPATAVLEFPDQGTKYYIPWFSSRTVPVDLSNLPVHYTLKSEYYTSVIATGTIGYSSEIAAAKALAGQGAEALAAASDNQKATLDDLIRRNQYVAMAEPQQDESHLHYVDSTPVYTQPHHGKHYVRGYW